MLKIEQLDVKERSGRYLLEHFGDASHKLSY